MNIAAACAWLEDDICWETSPNQILQTLLKRDYILHVMPKGPRAGLCSASRVEVNIGEHGIRPRTAFQRFAPH